MRYRSKGAVSPHRLNRNNEALQGTALSPGERRQSAGRWTCRSFLLPPAARIARLLSWRAQDCPCCGGHPVARIEIVSIRRESLSELDASPRCEGDLWRDVHEIIALFSESEARQPVPNRVLTLNLSRARRVAQTPRRFPTVNFCLFAKVVLTPYGGAPKDWFEFTETLPPKQDLRVFENAPLQSPNPLKQNSSSRASALHTTLSATPISLLGGACGARRPVTPSQNHQIPSGSSHYPAA